MNRIIRLCASVFLVGVLITGCFHANRYSMERIYEQYRRWEPMPRWEYEEKHSNSNYDFFYGDVDAQFMTEEFLGFPPGNIQAAVKLIKERNPYISVEFSVDGMTCNGANAVPELKALLSDKDPLVLQFACQALRNIDTAAASTEPEIRKLLKHEDPYVVGASAEALIYIGVDKKDSIACLVKLLENGDPDVTKRAAGACWIINEEPSVYPKLLKLVKDDNPEVRRQALNSLDGIKEGDGLLPALIGALKDEDVTVVQAALYDLSEKTNSPGVLDALSEAAHHNDPSIRSSALSDIAQSDDARVEDILKGALTDPDQDVRARAGYELMGIAPDYKPDVSIILDMIKTKEFGISQDFQFRFKKLNPDIQNDLLSQLISKMDDLGPEVRDRLLPILSDTEGVDLTPNLIKGLSSDDASVRAFSAAGLGDPQAPTAEAVGGLEKLLDDTDARVRVNAATSLNRIGGPKAPLVPVLLELLDNNDPEIRRDSISVLKEIGPDAIGALDALVGLFHDDDILLPRYAIEAVGNIGPGAVGATSELAAMLKNPDSSLRSEAAYALCKIGPAAVDAIDALIGVLDDPSDAVRARAAGALGIIAPRGEKAIPHLIEALKIEGDRARASVAEALGRYGPLAKDALPGLIDLLNYTQNPGAGNKQKGDAMAAFFSLGEPDVSIVAALAIYRIDPASYDVPGYVKNKLSSEDFSARAAAAKCIRLLSDDDAYSVLPELKKRLVSTEGNLVRQIVIKKLGDMGPTAENAVGELLAILDEKENVSQDFAIDALGRIGSATAVPRLKSILAKWDVYYQLHAIIALWRIDPGSIDPLKMIRERMETDDPEILSAVCWAFGEIGPKAKDVLSKLREIAKNGPEYYVRVSASTAISKIESTWVDESGNYKPCCIDYWLGQ